MKFNYQARTKTGEIQSGEIEASSKEAALTLLQKYNLYVTFLEEASTQPILTRRIKFLERISKQEIAVFFRQLAVMFKSKVPIIEALYILAKQTKNISFNEKIIKIAQEVEGGTSLSQALSNYPRLFNYFYISMIKSGEVSGKLSDALEYLADHIEREYSFQTKIRGAMIYPLFVLFVFSIVIVIMTVFVIPRMSEVLIESGQELPFLTKMIVSFSVFFRKWGLLIFFLLLGLIFFLYRYSKTTEGKKLFDRLLLKTPILGDLFKKIYITRLSENLSTLITAGLPITQALEITSEIVSNDVYQNIIIETRDEVRRGEQISSTFERYPNFIPPILFQMALTGEKTGNLDESLMNVVRFYRQEIEQRINTLIGLLEPVMIIFLGVLVGIIVASILMPLYQMGGM